MENMKHTIHRLLSLLLVLALVICAVPAVFADDPVTTSNKIKELNVVDGTDGWTPVITPAPGQVLYANLVLEDDTKIGVTDDENTQKYTYTWHYKDNTDVVATGPVYTVTDGNNGKQLCVTVTNKNDNTDTKTWEATETITLQVTGVQVVSGDVAVTQPYVGQKLTAQILTNFETILPGNTNAHYKWYYKDAEATVLSENAEYEVTEADLGKMLCVNVKMDSYTPGEATWEAPNVVANETGISITTTTNKLTVGSTFTFAAAKVPATATVEWSVSDTTGKIATIDKATGKLTAVSAGTSKNGTSVTVTATLKAEGATDVTATTVVTIFPATAKNIELDVRYDRNAFDKTWFRSALGTSNFSYVVFGPPSHGTLEYKDGSKYYGLGSSQCYYNAAIHQISLNDVYFTPSNRTYNTATINYTAYNADGNMIATGKMDLTPDYIEAATAKIRYYVDGDEVLSFDEDDFRSALRSVYTGATLDYVLFDMDNAYFGGSYGGSSRYGYLYTTSSLKTKLTGSNDGTKFYYNASRYEDDLDDVTYAPGSASGKYTVSIPYTAYATDSTSYYGYKAVTGTVEIVVNGVDYYTISAIGTDLSGLGSDILTLYPSATHVAFTQPTNGTLYYDYDAINDYGHKVRSNEAYALKYTKGEYDVDDVALIPAAGATKVTVYFDIYSGNTKLDSSFVTFAIKSRTSSAAFYDVTASNTGTWSADSIDFMYANGLIKGVGGNKFSPNASMKRADLVVMLYRLAGSPSVKYVDNPFKDVKSSDYYYNAVLWAYANDVVKGSGNFFNPKSDITREQLATILYRYAGKPYSSTRINGFTDSGKVSSYALDAMKWAVGNGVINGSGSKLDPQGSATRAQVAAMFHRYLTK